MKITQEHLNIMTHTRPGVGWAENLKRNLEDLLAEQSIRGQIQAARCLACPLDCPSCTTDQSDCECYEHQDAHALRDEILASMADWELKQASAARRESME